MSKIKEFLQVLYGMASLVVMLACIGAVHFIFSVASGIADALLFLRFRKKSA